MTENGRIFHAVCEIGNARDRIFAAAEKMTGFALKDTTGGKGI